MPHHCPGETNDEDNPVLNGQQTGNKFSGKILQGQHRLSRPGSHPLQDGPASIHVDCLAGYVIRILRGQEHRHMGNVLRRSQPVEGDSLQEKPTNAGALGTSIKI